MSKPRVAVYTDPHVRGTFDVLHTIAPMVAHRLEFVNMMGEYPEPRHADIHIIHQYHATDEHLDKFKPNEVIVLDRYDCSQVIERDAIRHPAVRNYWKHSVCPLRLTMQGHARPHFQFIRPEEPWDDKVSPKLKEIDEESAKKAVPGLSFAHWHKIRRWIDKPYKEFDRNLDVSFAGRVAPYNQPVTYHRQQCVDAIEKMKKRKMYHSSYGRELSINDYDNMLMHTKVAVSPFGVGETCWRDFEGQLAGCVVVKPHAYDIETLGGVLEYIPCAPDFSDLESVVDQILTNWDDYEDYRLARRAEVLKVISYEFISEWFMGELLTGA